MSRSLYKPNIPVDLNMLNLSKNEQAFYRATDKPGRKIVRLATASGSTILTLYHLKIRILLHNGRRYIPLLIVNKMVGHRLGEFRRTKQTGLKIHHDNKTEKKRQKKISRLKLEAQQRKNRKKGKKGKSAAGKKKKVAGKKK
jgi:ribosomal protein S19